MFIFYISKTASGENGSNAARQQKNNCEAIHLQDECTWATQCSDKRFNASWFSGNKGIDIWSRGQTKSIIFKYPEFQVEMSINLHDVNRLKKLWINFFPSEEVNIGLIVY